MAIRLATLLLAALMPFTALAGAPAASPLLLGLAGEWDLTGSVLGKSVHYHATGRWVLDEAWLEFSMTDVAKPPGYQAQVFIGYDPKSGDYVAHWLDRFGAAGARVAASGRQTGGGLVLLFPYADGAFRDTLTLAPGGASGSLLLESQHPDGSWSTFASYRMTRRAASQASGPAR